MSERVIDFYFDFSSPFAYPAAEGIVGLEERTGCKVRWNPMLLGAVFKKIGGEPLISIPMKGDYVRNDLQRTCRKLGLTITLPEGFPFATVSAARAFYWLNGKDVDLAEHYALAIFRRCFKEGQEIGSVDAALAVGESLGIAADELRHALQDADVKLRLRNACEAAIEKGVFGSPYFIFDREPFWGQDRMGQLEEWVATGGW